MAAVLQTLRGAHAQTTSDLHKERTVRNQLQVDKNNLRQDKADLTASLGAARMANDGLVEDLSKAIGVQDDLRAEVSTAQQEIGSLSQAKQAVEGALESLTVAHNILADQHEQLGGAHEDLQARHDTLSVEYEQWNREFGTLIDLQDRATELRTDIAQMEDRRKALILSRGRERTTGFACTGSMEPRLTCLDTATWAHDAAPSDIVVGATISFPATACSGEPSSIWIAHRVVDLKVVDGVQYYWPKGDNNEKADGCWVRHGAIGGYMIALHQNTKPANATLRNNVNASSEAYKAAKDRYVELRAAEGCPTTGPCYVEDHSPLWGAWSSYQRAMKLYECWQTNAETSEYPGHIPRPCP